MAQGRRVERVAALIRKEVSELMINGIRDERVHQGMVSITEVEVSGDLQHCKIFVSVFGEAQERDQVLEGLQAASGFLRGELGRLGVDRWESGQGLAPADSDATQWRWSRQSLDRHPQAREPAVGQTAGTRPPGQHQGSPPQCGNSAPWPATPSRSRRFSSLFGSSHCG